MQYLWQVHSQNFANNLADRIHAVKCKFQHNDKKCGTCRIKYRDCDFFPEYVKNKR